MKKQLAIDLLEKDAAKIKAEILEFDSLFQECLNQIEQKIELETVPQAIFPFGIRSNYLREDGDVFINKSEIAQSKSFKDDFFFKPK